MLAVYCRSQFKCQKDEIYSIMFFSVTALIFKKPLCKPTFSSFSVFGISPGFPTIIYYTQTRDSGRLSFRWNTSLAFCDEGCKYGNKVSEFKRIRLNSILLSMVDGEQYDEYTFFFYKTLKIMDCKLVKVIFQGYVQSYVLSMFR